MFLPLLYQMNICQSHFTTYCLPCNVLSSLNFCRRLFLSSGLFHEPLFPWFGHPLQYCFFKNEKTVKNNSLSISLCYAPQILMCFKMSPDSKACSLKEPVFLNTLTAWRVGFHLPWLFHFFKVCSCLLWHLVFLPLSCMCFFCFFLFILSVLCGIKNSK